ncbi:hypothetical protein CEXT_214041 [Caerostris extrusa]|uniref:Uncharacterized protein n=1 Tax=Caerostris extrusa TaxID=172846 RepID=A0AAV4QZ94_CAEEX|nr:hypothetical protein CEXT_214041 [Caerostris extrusa]
MANPRSTSTLESKYDEFKDPAQTNPTKEQLPPRQEKGPDRGPPTPPTQAAHPLGGIFLQYLVKSWLNLLNKKKEAV